MATYTIQDSTINKIKNAIRTKTGRTNLFPTSACAEEIASILEMGKGDTITNVTNTAIQNAIASYLNLENSNYDNAHLAVNRAISFWNAKSGGSITFDYRNGNNAFKGNVTNASSRGIIDCSGFVGLILRGYDYMSSVYATKRGANLTCSASETKALAGSETDLDAQVRADELTYGTAYSVDGKYRIITAADIALFYHSMGRTWMASDTSKVARPGDICFFAKIDEDGSIHHPNRFMGISHVGIMISPELYLNATDTGTTEGILATRVSVRPPLMYARPLYGSLTDGATSGLTVGKNNLINRIGWAEVPQGASTRGGFTWNLAGNKLTWNGSSTSATTTDLVKKSCGIYLPPGTYRLSGFVNGTGANAAGATHSIHGMRVWGNANLDGNGSYSGVTGTTKSSNGANTAERTPCWDLGGGCEFTLSRPMMIKLDLYLGSGRNYTNCSCDPVLTKIG